MTVNQPDSVILCPCGQPLHYANDKSQSIVAAMVEDLGERQKVTVGSDSWMVPRHYTALHGFKGYELAGLAEQYGWEKL